LGVHLTGVIGGVIWNIGMAMSIIASGKAGFAISYGLDREQLSLLLSGEYSSGRNSKALQNSQHPDLIYVPGISCRTGFTCICRNLIQQIFFKRLLFEFKFASKKFNDF